MKAEQTTVPLVAGGIPEELRERPQWVNWKLERRGFTLEQRRYSVRKSCEKLKAEISIEDYLREHGVEVRRNRARCIVHGGSNPHSFSINPEKGLWHCFSCQHGGDLIDLCELVERHADTWTACVSLSLAFGVELPRRPERWHDRQEEKERIRRKLLEIRRESYRRRYFRFYREELEAIEDPEEREEEAREIWKQLGFFVRRFLR
jgi:DNA primase